MTIYGLSPRDQRGYHDLASAGHIILTPTQPVGARTVLGCVSNPRPLGHGAKPLPTELSRPPYCFTGALCITTNRCTSLKQDLCWRRSFLE
ncbi:hypothetical protein ElyMa_005151300 [Elysia marginata]|uniref:Uncharacterized protein n=1 Tax=Elysia marginata TaxID=1093978 RepID=A0AAV4JRP5_9GAST|nr:hypothetical protein ElyMa_005151300 [Elysia marginata]